ncbi:MAG: AlpA family phage regulatory protein [Mailhella sp.]|nr:AlpA family phage regulatory protein [Mailhella sp.]
MKKELPVIGFLRLPQVLEIIPVSKSTWCQGGKDGRFPKPVKLGPKTTAWRVEDIAVLIERIGSTNNDLNFSRTI